MIRYALACDAGHEFESWFPSASSFDDQGARGLVRCPVCDSAQIRKQIMAPSVASERSKAMGQQPDGAPAGEQHQPMALLSEREQALRAAIKAVRDQIAKQSDYVGPDFAEEARRMHYGEVEHRSIYGEADSREARALIEEGIEIMPLPRMPDDRN